MAMPGSSPPREECDCEQVHSTEIRLQVTLYWRVRAGTRDCSSVQGFGWGLSHWGDKKSCDVSTGGAQRANLVCCDDGFGETEFLTLALERHFLSNLMENAVGKEERVDPLPNFVCVFVK